MPELPDLEAIRNILNPKIANVKIERVEILQSNVIRHPAPDEFIQILIGNSISEIARRGKYLLFKMDSGHILTLHLMLAGGLQFCDSKTNRKSRTCFVLYMEDGRQLRCFSGKPLCIAYLVKSNEISSVPRWKEMGPDALDESLDLVVFRQKLKYHSGQIKDVLVNSDFLTGIGNAYADEILFQAGIYPFWPCTSLSDDETEAVYNAMKLVLRQAIEKVTNRMGEDTSVIIRDFLKVHRMGGKPCPSCGAEISQVQQNRKITSFCRSCQKD